MRTLLLSDVFPPRTGGSGRWFREIYGRLPRDRYLIAAGDAPHQDEYDQTHDLNVVRLPLTMPAWGVLSVEGLRGYRRTIAAVSQVVEAARVSMIHCGRCLPEGVMARALKLRTGIPYACYVHGEDVSTAAASREHSWLARRALLGADFVIANSRNTAALLEGDWALPPDRIRLLYPGVDTARFVPAPRDPIARRRLGWGDRPVVLTVGRLQARKGHDMMIRALDTIRRTIPDVLYAIVGDGEEREPLRRLVESLGHGDRVQFLGEPDDDELVRCYQQCDLFALPNRQVGRDIEGFGMVLLEAQACGKPVLAGASGGTAETMSIPETGRVVPCDGPDELAGAVLDLLSDPDRLALMGEAARRWAVERFDWSALARQAACLFGEDATAPLPPAELVLR